jgi:hypothetical protein
LHKPAACPERCGWSPTAPGSHLVPTPLSSHPFPALQACELKCRACQLSGQSSFVDAACCRQTGYRCDKTILSLPIQTVVWLLQVPVIFLLYKNKMLQVGIATAQQAVPSWSTLAHPSPALLVTLLPYAKGCWHFSRWKMRGKALSDLINTLKSVR